MSDAPKLKDHFDRELVEALGARIERVHPDFVVGGFTQQVFSDDPEPFADLTFTGRTRRIAHALRHSLELDVPDALAVLLATLPEELDLSEQTDADADGQTQGPLEGGFWMWPYGDFIALYATDHYEAGLEACYELTKRFTAEFAIRPFLAQYPETLDRLAEWTTDPSEHVRRLVSEGTRSRLPWAQRLNLPVDRVLGLLTELRADPSTYVRRSVANHLNDLAKDDSERILDILEGWHAEDVPATTWIVRHALRNHLKAGDPRVLRLFGYDTPELDIVELTASPASVAIGETIEVSLEVAESAGRDQRIMIDLVVGYVKANGSRSPKVFKFRDIELAAGASMRATKSLPMVQRSTRTLHAGDHSVSARINGVDSDPVWFSLDAASSPDQRP